jgi:hypothetical protein
MFLPPSSLDYRTEPLVPAIGIELFMSYVRYLNFLCLWSIAQFMLFTKISFKLNFDLQTGIGRGATPHPPPPGGKNHGWGGYALCRFAKGSAKK